MTLVGHWSLVIGHSSRLLLGGGRLLVVALTLFGLLLLGLLEDDLHDPDLGQPERTAAVGPFLLVLQRLDALGPGQHAPVRGAAGPSLQGLIDRHGNRTGSEFAKSDSMGHRRAR